MALEIQHDVPLRPLTTFNIGGAAKYLASVRSEDDLHEALLWAREHNERFVIIAGGSNMLVADAGFDGLVLHIESDSHSFAGNELTADAGCNLLSLIRAASEKGLGGWEHLSGIPGTIGGAVRGNAGAFGSEIKDFVIKVQALNMEIGAKRDFINPDMDFSYRHSFFKDHPEWIITHAVIRLLPVEPTESMSSIERTIAEREKRHLQNVQAAGSFFMNPKAPPVVRELFEQEKNTKAREGRVPAGWLIEKAGMKGATVGGAIASFQHPNYIVNTGNATAKDVRALAEQIKIAVHEKFGVTLCEEAALL